MGIELNRRAHIWSVSW